MNAKKFLLRRDFAPDEAAGRRYPDRKIGELHRGLYLLVIQREYNINYHRLTPDGILKHIASHAQLRWDAPSLELTLGVLSNVL